MTNLWEKEFLERFRKERSAQHPLRRAPNSCMRHRVETVNLGWEKCISFLALHINIRSCPDIKYLLSPQSNLCLTDPNGPGSWAETRTDTSAGNRKREKRYKDRKVGYKWSSVCFLFSGWVVLSDRGVLPREDPGVLAQVQVQQRVGVLIAGAQSLRERHHSWERWIKGKRDRDGKRGREVVQY